MFVTAIIVAGGSSSRMEGTDKMQLLLDGSPVLAYSIRAFLAHSRIDEVIVVAREDLVSLAQELGAGAQKPFKVVKGGTSRCLSVRNGVHAMSPECDIVLIHDGARPFVEGELIDRVLNGAMEKGACAPGLPVVNTVKRVDEEERVLCTVDRTDLREIGTPQGFSAPVYRQLIDGTEESFDDCQLMEEAGYPVYLVEGDNRCFKITTPADIQRARQQVAPMDIRVGHGYDVHRFVEGRPFILGGVSVPYERGLLGHSDADALLHAVCDAILGACSLRDIGYHFPDTDEKWKGADSRVLLRACVEMAQKKGYRADSVDCTILCQRPKLAGYLEEMAANIAADCNLTRDRVNVKATTEEGLGFTGSGEGIACHAVAVLKG